MSRIILLVKVINLEESLRKKLSKVKAIKVIKFHQVDFLKQRGRLVEEKELKPLIKKKMGILKITKM